MKKILIATILGISVLGLVGCGNSTVTKTQEELAIEAQNVKMKEEYDKIISLLAERETLEKGVDTTLLRTKSSSEDLASYKLSEEDKKRLEVLSVDDIKKLNENAKQINELVRQLDSYKDFDILKIDWKKSDGSLWTKQGTKLELNSFLYSLEDLVAWEEGHDERIRLAKEKEEAAEKARLEEVAKKEAEAKEKEEALAKEKERIEKEAKLGKEGQNALKKAQMYSDSMHMSKKGLYNQLTSSYGEGFSAEAAQYAVDNVKADWKANALEKAKTYQDMMAMSPSAILDQLTSSHGENFTREEAQYAVDNL